MGRVEVDEADAIDEGALRGLMPSLHALALARLRNEADADDAVQETLVRVVEHRAAWRPDAPFASWVFTIAANVIRNRVRHDRVRREHASPAPASEDLDPSEALQKVEDLGAVVRALNRLPPEEAAPILMHYAHGVPQREVAAHLDISVEHLRVRLFRTLKKLRDALKE